MGYLLVIAVKPGSSLVVEVASPTISQWWAYGWTKCKTNARWMTLWPVRYCMNILDLVYHFLNTVPLLDGWDLALSRMQDNHSWPLAKLNASLSANY